MAFFAEPPRAAILKEIAEATGVRLTNVDIVNYRGILVEADGLGTMAGFAKALYDSRARFDGLGKYISPGGEFDPDYEHIKMVLEESSLGADPLEKSKTRLERKRKNNIGSLENGKSLPPLYDELKEQYASDSAVLERLVVLEDSVKTVPVALTWCDLCTLLAVLEIRGGTNIVDTSGLYNKLEETRRILYANIRHIENQVSSDDIFKHHVAYLKQRIEDMKSEIETFEDMSTRYV